MIKSRLFLLEVVVGLIVSSSHLAAQNIQSVSLAWDPSPSTEVTSYVVRYGLTSQSYSMSTNVGNRTTAAINGLQAGNTYYFVVTARNAAGTESVPSNEISYQVPTTGSPVITLLSPTGGAKYQSPATITCSASVTANGHTITKVQFFNGATLLAEDTTTPYNYTWANVAAGSYSLTARMVYDAGSTLSSSAANITVTNAAPPNGLTFEPSSGTITAPFLISGGTLSQLVETSLTTGGRAVYNFNIVTPGNYTVSAIVNAPTTAEDSFFVNIDAEPTSPYMVWHIPLTTGFQSRVVSWQGNGGVGSSEFIPKVFTLAAGTHQLIIRGREANVRLGTITISPVGTVNPPTIALTSPTNGANFSATATVNLAATVNANGHTITKVQFFNGSTLLGEDTSTPYSFSWNNVGPGNYALKSRVVYDSGSAVDSSVANIVVTGLPAPWQTADIGSPGLVGSASQSSGVYTVRGAGQLAGTSDSFRYVYQSLSGDGEIKVRLTSVQTNSTSGRFGVMIRENLSSTSKYAFMGLSQNLNFRWQRRSTTGGSTSSTSSTPSLPPNAWVRLVRRGNTIIGYMSADGANWTQVNSRVITMAANVHVGFVTASGSTNSLSTAFFANGVVVPFQHVSAKSLLF